jgi:hypothetical protein
MHVLTKSLDAQKSNKEIISYHSLGVINQEILARSAVYALHESYHACIVQNLGLAWRPIRMRRSGPHPQGVISGELGWRE